MAHYTRGYKKHLKSIGLQNQYANSDLLQIRIEYDINKIILTQFKMSGKE